MIADAIGVIGGVGPLATVYFMDRVVALTKATRDQDHANLVVLQHSAIPDRTAYITGRSQQDPLPVLMSDAALLEQMGVSAIVMPCNTADHFHAELAQSVSIPFPSIVDIALQSARARVPGLSRLGVLATDGTLHSGLYERACEREGLAFVRPSDDVQAEVMDVIYTGVKAGHPVPSERYEALLDHLRRRGAEAIVLGCTELSVLGHDHGLAWDVVDSLDALARRTIELSGKPVV